jgi:hypothetical protein
MSKFRLIIIRLKEEVNRNLKLIEILHKYAKYANIFKD